MGFRQGDELDELSAIRSAGQAIAPLHKSIGPVHEGDWLDVHDERGQSFEEYRHSQPVVPTAERTTVYLQPLGDFDPARASAIEATEKLLEVFYGMPVHMLVRMDLAWVPRHARRLHPYSGQEQVLTKFVLRLLRRKKPVDAVAVLALTSADLWPGRGWNFVFGQASLRDGVGVWSLHRMGDQEVEPGTFLRRTVKIAVHETGHMLGIRHCTPFQCGMNGANHQDEADGRPIWFCPDDEMKIWWACRATRPSATANCPSLPRRTGWGARRNSGRTPSVRSRRIARPDSGAKWKRRNGRSCVFGRRRDDLARDITSRARIAQSVGGPTSSRLLGNGQAIASAFPYRLRSVSRSRFRGIRRPRIDWGF